MVRVLIEVRCDWNGCDRKARGTASLSVSGYYPEDGLDPDIAYDDIELDEPGWNTRGDLESCATCPECGLGDV